MAEERNYLPNFWDDDSRMNAYLSPLRTVVNPEGMQYKIAFWETAVERFCHVTNTVAFSQEELSKSFERNGKTPQCFQEIILHMIRVEEVCTHEDFWNMKPSHVTETWSMWVWQMGKMSMHWAWDSIRNAVFQQTFSVEDKFVHKAVVQAKAEDILLKATDMRGEVVSLNSLMKKCNIPENKIESMFITLYYLYCQNQAALLLFNPLDLSKVLVKFSPGKHFDPSDPSKVLVKFSPDKHFNRSHLSKVLVKLSAVNQVGSVTISDRDVQKYDLLELSKKIEDKIDELEAKCNKAQEEARLFLAKKSKVLAMNQLKKRKAYEESIRKDADVLLNLHKMIETLDETEINVEVVAALKRANAAVKNTNKEANLSEESVADVMDDIRETIEAQNDMTLALAGPVSDEDVEKEFSELETEIAEEDRLCQLVRDLNLPDASLPSLSKLGGNTIEGAKSATDS